MKKLLALIPFFTFAACGGIDNVNLGKDAGAQDGGGGIGGAGTTQCECPVPSNDGTRLTQQFIVGDDGSRMDLFVWYDNKLDLNCSYQSLPNGETRCVPPHSPMNTYADSGCIEPVFVNVSTSKPDQCTVAKFSKYVRLDVPGFTPDPCDSNVPTFTFYGVNTDAPINQGEGVVWYVKSQSGACEAQPSLVGTGYQATVYGTQKIGDLESFVKATQGVGF